MSPPFFKKKQQLNLAAILIFDKCNKLQLEQLSIKTYTGHWMLTGCLIVSQPAPHFPPGITFVNSFSSVKSFWLSDFLEFFTVCWNPSARVRLWQCLLHAFLLSFLELKSEDAEQEIKIFLNPLILIFSSIFIWKANCNFILCMNLKSGHMKTVLILFLNSSVFPSFLLSTINSSLSHNRHTNSFNSFKLWATSCSQLELHLRMCETFRGYEKSQTRPKKV